MCETTNQLFLPISCGYRTWLFSLRKMYQADLNIHTGSFMASTPNYIVFTASMSHWETFHLQQQKHILQNRFLMVSLNIRVYTSHVMAILMVKKMKKTIQSGAQPSAARGTGRFLMEAAIPCSSALEVDEIGKGDSTRLIRMYRLH